MTTRCSDRFMFAGKSKDRTTRKSASLVGARQSRVAQLRSCASVSRYPRGVWKVVLLGLFIACNGSVEDPVDGSLVALDEGETTSRPLANGVKAAADWPSWASIEDGTLVLAPGCEVVTGTDGPPKVFSLGFITGEPALLVQVTPTIAGACLPRVLACISAGPTDCVSDQDFHDQSTGRMVDEVLDLTFTGPDKQIVFRLYNPDAGDTQLNARLTTDAPIAFVENENRFSGDLRGGLANSNITGDFRVSYEIARGMSIEARIATGAYRLRWNDDEIHGIEVASCATANANCTLVRNAAGWCVQEPTGNAQITVALRLWTGPHAPHAPQPGAPDTLLLRGVTGGAPPPIFTSATTTQPQTITVPLDIGAQPVAANLGANLDNKRVTLELFACVAPCAAGGMPSATVELAIRTRCP